MPKSRLRANAIRRPTSVAAARIRNVTSGIRRRVSNFQFIAAPRRDRERYLFAVLFFFSGFSSLVYQVVWMRQLSLFFGSDVYSAAVTLSCFMAGLSLGSLVVARF